MLSPNVKRPINYFKLDQQCRQQALTAYCPNIYTVVLANILAIFFLCGKDTACHYYIRPDILPFTLPTFHRAGVCTLLPKRSPLPVTFFEEQGTTALKVLNNSKITKMAFQTHLEPIWNHSDFSQVT